MKKGVKLNILIKHYKQIVIIVILFVLAFCGYKIGFKSGYNYYNNHIYIWVDPDTGVNYIINHGAATPRLDDYGGLMISGGK